MVIAVGISAGVGFSIFLKRRTAVKSLESNDQKQFAETSSPPYRSLFAPTDEEMYALRAEEAARLAAAETEVLRRSLRMQIERREFGALENASAGLYDETLDAIIALNLSEAEIADLGKFIYEENLPTSAAFVRLYKSFWRVGREKLDTVRLVHFAARSGNAQVFADAAETVFAAFDAGELEHFNRKNLVRLVSLEFNLLPAAERNSGAGFWTKQRLGATEKQEKSTGRRLPK